jgi:hypothetical protein
VMSCALRVGGTRRITVGLAVAAGVYRDAV